MISSSNPLMISSKELPFLKTYENEFITAYLQLDPAAFLNGCCNFTIDLAIEIYLCLFL